MATSYRKSPCILEFVVGDDDALRNPSVICAGFFEDRSTILLSWQISNYRSCLNKAFFAEFSRHYRQSQKSIIPTVRAIISTLHVYDNVPQHTHAVFEWCFYRAQSIAR